MQMKRKNLALLAGSAALLPLAYGMGATAAIRLAGCGVMKKLPSARGVVLTFDDGPNPVYTPQLLDLLAHYQINAVFFVVGERARRYPDIIRRMHAEGHQIGIHHDRHTSSWLLTPFGLKREIDNTHRTIEDITGEPPTLYRPPWGFMNASTPFMAEPYQIVLWSHVFQDWKVESCETKLLDGLRQLTPDGSIVLLHDDGTNPGADDEAPAHMLDKLSKYLKEARKKNIEFTGIHL